MEASEKPAAAGRAWWRRRAPREQAWLDQPLDRALGSVEYELTQLRRAVDEVRLRRRRATRAQASVAADPAAFRSKLRNPAVRERLLASLTGT